MVFDGIEFISTVDTAKLVRKALKDEFPGVRFSVRSERYARRSHIIVRWTGGPSLEDVEQVARRYEGSRSSLDEHKSQVTHWLRPDGRTLVYNARRTLWESEIDNRSLAPQVPSDARLVQFEPYDVFCYRVDTEQE